MDRVTICEVEADRVQDGSGPSVEVPMRKQVTLHQSIISRWMGSSKAGQDGAAVARGPSRQDRPERTGTCGANRGARTQRSTWSRCSKGADDPGPQGKRGPQGERGEQGPRARYTPTA